MKRIQSNLDDHLTKWSAISEMLHTVSLSYSYPQAWYCHVPYIEKESIPINISLHSSRIRITKGDQYSFIEDVAHSDPQ